MLDEGVLKLKLCYGLDFKSRARMAGHWMIWIIGEDQDRQVRYERIKHRVANVLIGDRHTRQRLGDVWILAGDYDLDAHWPQWEGLGCQPLPRKVALGIISDAIEAASERVEGEVSDG